MEWISVKDRLPETTDTVLAYIVGYGATPEIVMVQKLWEHGYWRHRNYGTIDEFVTHWQPLPEPPKTK